MSSSNQEYSAPSFGAKPVQPELDRLEWLTFGHVAILVLFGAWAFGGNALWVRDVMSIWGSLGALLPLLALCDRKARQRSFLRPLIWLWPFALFNALILASALNPNYREVTDGMRTLYVPRAPELRIPSSAIPGISLQSLWFFDAVYLAAFNIVLLVRRRSTLRILLFVMAANAMILAVFGSIQKLMNSPGLYFGAVKSPQVLFFASFIYHNHWGAFILLMTAASLGLIFHHARRKSTREFLHSPAFGGLVALVFLAASVPLSGSRSCTLALGFFLAGAFIHWLRRVIQNRKRHGEPTGLPIIAASLTILGILTFAYVIGFSTVGPRLASTEAQILAMQEKGEVIPRQVLYRDTWAMAKDQLWFGWGMGTYELVFQNYNTVAHASPDGLPTYYHDAHSDWLQSAAEVGLAGTSLLGLCAIVPLWHRRRIATQSLISRYLLAGCTIVTLYAWIEFPFGNRAVVATWWVCFFCAIHYGRLPDGGAASFEIPHAQPSATDELTRN